MSIATLILGESGTGKTASLRNFDPAKTLLIQPIRKPLPFRCAGWDEIKKTPEGTWTDAPIFVCSDPEKIVRAMARCRRDVIVIDDWQYILALMFMAKRNEKGFDKFTSIGGAGFDICQAATTLVANKRVYILAHTSTDDMGQTRIKTLGKLLDDKIVVEGLFTTVLRTCVDRGIYKFSTQNSGNDTVKSPMGLFDDGYIENDLASVDDAICDYYGIKTESANKNSIAQQLVEKPKEPPAEKHEEKNTEATDDDPPF